MKNHFVLVMGGLDRCISHFFCPSKPIIEKYPNFPRTQKLNNLVLIVEDKNTISINSGESNVYMFLYADFEGVEV